MYKIIDGFKRTVGNYDSYEEALDVVSAIETVTTNNEIIKLPDHAYLKIRDVYVTVVDIDYADNLLWYWRNDPDWGREEGRIKLDEDVELIQEKI